MNSAMAINVLLPTTLPAFERNMLLKVFKEQGHVEQPTERNIVQEAVQLLVFYAPDISSTAEAFTHVFEAITAGIIAWRTLCQSNGVETNTVLEATDGTHAPLDLGSATDAEIKAWMKQRSQPKK